MPALPCLWVRLTALLPGWVLCLVGACVLGSQPLPFSVFLSLCLRYHSTTVPVSCMRVWGLPPNVLGGFPSSYGCIFQLFLCPPLWMTPLLYISPIHLSLWFLCVPHPVCVFIPSSWVKTLALNQRALGLHFNCLILKLSYLWGLFPHL